MAEIGAEKLLDFVEKAALSLLVLHWQPVEKVIGSGNDALAPVLRSRDWSESPDSPPFRGLDVKRNPAFPGVTYVFNRLPDEIPGIYARPVRFAVSYVEYGCMSYAGGFRLNTGAAMFKPECAGYVV